jgi:hypothetical protein
MSLHESPEKMDIELSPSKNDELIINDESDHSQEADDEDNDADRSDSMIDTVPASPRGGLPSQRSRKTVNRITMSPEVRVSSKSRHVPTSGEGMKLGDISKIADKLYKVKVKDDALKRLHRILYGSDGTATGRKKEIRLWNGSSDEATKTSMMTGLAGAKSVKVLKDICGYLSLATGGDRASLESRIFEFLVHPTGSSDPLKKKKKKQKSDKKSKKKQSSNSSNFGQFLNIRMPDVLAKAAGTISPQDITDLLTFEWKNMSEIQRGEFGRPNSKPKTDKVQKIIAKSPKSEADETEGSSDSDSSSSSLSSSPSSSSSSSSSCSADSP